MYVSTTELCGLLGIDSGTLYYLEKELAFPKIKPDVYNFKACAKWMINHLRAKLKSSSTEKLNETKIELNKAKAEKAKIENEILGKKVIPIERVKSDLVIAINKYKERGMNLCSVLANNCVSLTDEAMAYEFVYGMFSEMINELADEFEKMTPDTKVSPQ